MLTRTALALLLLLAPAATAQELDTALSALVKISGTRDGTLVRGSGFVVDLERDKATIVTASHVIEGAQQIEVVFAAGPTERFPADRVLGMDAGNPHGLAVFQVRGRLPARVATLRFAVDQPRQGDELFLAGFPEMALAPLTPRRALSGRRGTLLLVDQGVGEGFSGGPALLGGKVVGVVTEADAQTTYAVSFVVAREALQGWGVSPPPAPASPPAPPAASSRSPSHRTLRQGEPLRLAGSSVTLSVTFDDQLATLRIHSTGQPPIVEALLGPGGQIPFRSPLGEHLLSVIDWNPTEKTLELTIDPGI